MSRLLRLALLFAGLLSAEASLAESSASPAAAPESTDAVEPVKDPAGSPEALFVRVRGAYQRAWKNGMLVASGSDSGRS